MADHSANVGSISVKDKVITAGVGPHRVFAYPLKAGQADLEPGLIVSLDQDGMVVPYDEAQTDLIGTGDNSETAFSGTLAKAVPGSVSVTDGTETFTDDGFGTLTGDATGSGKVNYDTGKVSVTFNAAPGTDVEVNATFKPAIKGVLTREALADAAGAEVCVHGPVNRKELLVDASAPSAAVLAELDNLNLWPIG